MKTSNKLLIAFGLALILIPILGMVYVSQVNYTDEKSHANEIKKDDHFKMASPNMVSTPISNPFTSVNIEDAKGMGIEIRLIEDENYGVKIPENIKDQFTFDVDANHELHIGIKNSTQNDHTYVTILVYAPVIKQLIATNVGHLGLVAKTDSLSLNAIKIGSIGFGSNASINKLNINAFDVNEIYVGEDDIKSLSLELKNTTFKSENNSYDELSIRTAGESEIDITGNDEDNAKFSINKLTLNTLDKAKVKLENITVNNCSGSFSDQTKVQMPAANLNQMFNAKKQVTNK